MQTIFETDSIFLPSELKYLETLRHLAIQMIKFSVINETCFAAPNVGCFCGCPPPFCYSPF